MGKSRKTSSACCPFCNSNEFDMQIDYIGSNEIFVKCKCEKCYREYKETFSLTEQIWEVNNGL